MAAKKPRKRDNMPKRNKKNFRPTKAGAGMTKAGVAAYRRKNPGSKLQTAVTEDSLEQRLVLQDVNHFALVLRDR